MKPTFINEDVCCERIVPQEPPIGELMHETCSMAGDALDKVRRIRRFLFAAEEIESESERDPQCFREELMKTRYILRTVCEELERMCNAMWPT